MTDTAPCHYCGKPTPMQYRDSAGEVFWFAFDYPRSKRVWPEPVEIR